MDNKVILTGELIRFLRKKENMTQKELADKLYIEQSAISRWEKGTLYIKNDMYTKLAEIFGLDEAAFYNPEKTLQQLMQEYPLQQSDNEYDSLSNTPPIITPSKRTKFSKVKLLSYILILQFCIIIALSTYVYILESYRPAEKVYPIVATRDDQITSNSLPLYEFSTVYTGFLTNRKINQISDDLFHTWLLNYENREDSCAVRIHFYNNYNDALEFADTDRIFTIYYYAPPSAEQ